MLHTNFKLDIAGEYLALIKSDGVTVAHEYGPRYPRQLTDVSYGLAQYGTAIVPSGATASYKVPTLSDTGKDWTARSFNDSTWKTGPTGIGFGSTSLGFEVLCYQANTTVGDLGTAELVISNPTYQSVVTTDTAPMINYLNNGSNGHFGNDNPFPGTTIGNNVEDFVVLATGRILVPQDGNWTFGVNSDDGFDLELTNGTYTMTFSHPEPRSAGDTLATFNFPEWGLYDLRLVFYERSGDSTLEFFVAQGSHSSFNPTYFHLVGDIANGGLYVVSSGNKVDTDVQEQMQNVNASIWTRIQFEGEEVDFFDSLALRLRYEDAFVAYLNNAEVARDNFTGTPEWNSIADSDRPNELAAEFVHFDISDHLKNLREGNNVLAIHGLNDNKAEGEFLILPELLVASNRMMPQYFSSATPGQFNSAGSINIVADTKFSHDRGFYDEPFEVEISCQTSWATIRYTTDGSTPTENHGYEYTGPITINKTTCLRAIAFKPGWMPTNVDTQTYIFLDQVIRQPKRPAGFPNSWGSTSADYEMDPDVVNDSRYRSLMRTSLLSLPTMSIVTEQDNLFGQSGIYSNSLAAGVAWERPASIELFNPDGTTEFQVNAGLRIYGGDPFRGMNLTRKKSFRLLFKRDYGPTKLNFPLFDAEDAAERFDTIVLRAGSNDGWNNWGGANTQYIIDEFMHRTQLALGQVSPHGTFVHLYVNGLYWGLYHPTERPMASFCANYFGGDKEEWDALNSGTPTGESNTATWNSMLNQARGGLTDTESYQRIQGNNSDGTNNPNYDDLLDIENYIDWLFSNFWGGTGDWPWHNYFAGCRRPPNAIGFKFFNWDSEGAITIWSSLNANVTGVSNGGAEPYRRLKENSEFRLLFADHAHRHLFNNGPATSEASYARYKKLADQIELAIIAESARWGDQARSTPYTLADWQSARDYILNTYMPQRPNIVLQQLRNANLYPNINAPVFYINGLPQHGGEISPTDTFSMLTTAGTAYYTIDGNDVRLPTDPVDIISSVTLVAESATKRVLVPIGPVSNNWKGGGAFNDLAWTLSTGSPGGVGYERGSGYQSYISVDVEDQMYNGNTTCHIRIPFVVDTTDLAGFNFMRLQIRYDDGFVAYLNGTEVARRNFTGTPDWNSNAGSTHDDSAAVSLETIDISAFINKLQPGNNLLAIHGLNVSTTSSDLLISAKLIAGESTIVNEVFSPSAIKYTGPITLTESIHIKARALSGATWSALNEATFAVGPVADNLRITEIMYNPQDTNDPNDPNEEFIELKNIGTQTLNLKLVRFTNGIDFTFPSVELEAGEYILVVRDIEAFTAQYGIGYKIVGQYSGSLNNGGERIELEDAVGRTILNFRYRDGWYDITDGMGF
ncbi:MAG: chitobiase/beta-hexosaminidase C-terminal domain-containing protein [Planctomycetota bacterium]